MNIQNESCENTLCNNQSVLSLFKNVNARSSPRVYGRLQKGIWYRVDSGPSQRNGYGIFEFNQYSLPAGQKRLAAFLKASKQRLSASPLGNQTGCNPCAQYIVPALVSNGLPSGDLHLGARATVFYSLSDKNSTAREAEDWLKEQETLRSIIESMKGNKRPEYN